MRDAIEKMGAPADLVIAIEIPSLETTNELMQQCDRVLATGVAPWSQQHTRAERLLWALVLVTQSLRWTVRPTSMMLRPRFTCLKPSILRHRARLITPLFSLIAFMSQCLSGLKAKGGYLCNAEEKEKLRNTIWDDEGH